MDHLKLIFTTKPDSLSFVWNVKGIFSSVLISCDKKSVR